MKLQLNTGKTIELWYVPETENFATDVESGVTATLGPMDIALNSIGSIVPINVGIKAVTTNPNPDPVTDRINVQVIRNEDTSNPILERNFSFIDDVSEVYIYFSMIDNEPNEGQLENTRYSISLTPDVVGFTTSFSIVLVSFYEIDTPSVLTL